ncbi:MAG: DUF429 domain-containing protein [Burkholderiaceae bacterium]
MPPVAIPDSLAFAATKPRLFGVDFTCAPGQRKPSVVALGHLEETGNPNACKWRLSLDGFESFTDFAGFEELLMRPGPWAGGFDLPFGLPRELVVQFGWPVRWPELIRLYSSFSRKDLRDRFKQFCDARAPGNKFAHRATDRPAGSSASMKWVNPPVAWMLHAGAIRLLNAGVSIPGVLNGDSKRVCLEAYPGMLARSVTRASYKSDDRRRQTIERQDARQQILKAVETSDSQPGIATVLSRQDRCIVLNDGSGDSLDALLCLVQVAWSLTDLNRRFGLPATFDGLEGWIVGA